MRNRLRETPVSSGADQRRVLLQEAAIAAGRSWFDSWRVDLSGEGRAIEGGFPGTIREARSRVAPAVAIALSQKRLPRVTDEELGRAMRTTYDEARRVWLASPDRRRDADPGDTFGGSVHDPSDLPERL